MTETDILVLGGHAHGMPTTDLAAVLRTELPEYEIETAQTRQEIREAVAEVPIVTGGGPVEDWLDDAHNLKLFAAIGAGVGPGTVKPLVDRDVRVTSAAGVHAPNIAEYVIGSMLAFSRNLREGWRRELDREWRHYQARDFQASTVTVVGLGTIGQAIVERLAGFGVDTIGVRYTPSKGGPTDEVIGFESDAFAAALARTDYLVLACPLTDTTRQLIGHRELHLLHPESVIVNIGRGALIDTDALVRTIGMNGIHGVALDVTDPEPLPEDHPLWSFENVQITPHMSGHTPEYWERCADILVENVRRIERTGAYDDLRNEVTLTADGEVVYPS